MGKIYDALRDVEKNLNDINKGAKQIIDDIIASSPSEFYGYPPSIDGDGNVVEGREGNIDMLSELLFNI